MEFELKLSEHVENLSKDLAELLDLSEKADDEVYNTSWIIKSIKYLDEKTAVTSRQLIANLEEVGEILYNPFEQKLISKRNEALAELAKISKEREELNNKISTIEKELQKKILIKDEILEYKLNALKEESAHLVLFEKSQKTWINALKAVEDMNNGSKRYLLELAGKLIEQTNFISNPNKEKIKRNLVELSKNLITDAIPFSATGKKIIELTTGIDFEQEAWGTWDDNKKRDICFELINNLAFRVLFITSLTEIQMKEFSNFIEMSKNLSILKD